MGRAHSRDLRERIYGDVASGQSRRAAARRFGVSASTGVRLAKRMAETGSLAPARQGRPPGAGKLAPYGDRLIGWVEAERVEDPTAADVRVMTIHQSKGLEFDIVVLPGTDAMSSQLIDDVINARPGTHEGVEG